MKMTDLVQILSTFEKCVSEARQRGLLGEKECPSLLFPFEDHHIQCIYTQKKSGQSGAWFYLYDGSIWNCCGVQEEGLTHDDFT